MIPPKTLYRVADLICIRNLATTDPLEQAYDLLEIEMIAGTPNRLMLRKIGGELKKASQAWEDLRDRISS